MRLRQPTVIVACVVLTVALGLLVGGRGPGELDEVAGATVVGWPHGVLRALVLPTEPYVLLPALALLVVWCVLRSRPWDALFAVLGPSIAVAANTWLLKPSFGRWKNDTLVYPSGHTVGMVATVVVVFVLTHGLARGITVVAGVVLLVGVTIGMIGLGYHYLTDIVGGALFATAAVPAVHAAVGGRSRAGWTRRSGG
jgi:membrane-associated phospholipid phosphatase